MQWGVLRVCAEQAKIGIMRGVPLDRMVMALSGLQRDGG
jgi:hypothetical protein